MIKPTTYTKYIIITILIILIITVFIISLGNVNIGEKQSIAQEFRDTKDIALRKHKRLQTIIQKQEGLAIKLSKKFKLIYFFVRIAFVFLWLSVLFFLYYLNLITNLSDCLNYTEAGLLILLILNFLTFGTISNVRDYVEILRIKLENWIYGKYHNLSKKIEENKTSLMQTQKELL